MNRETWLKKLSMLMAPKFAELGAPLPTRIRMSIGFPSVGRRSCWIGECWDPVCTDDDYFEIFIRPDLDEPKEKFSITVAAILAHELTHAAVGLDAKHGPKFAKIARGLGLTGKMASTVAGPLFEEFMKPILKKVGRYPGGKFVIYSE